MKRLFIYIIFISFLSPVMVQAQQDELNIRDRMEIMEKFLEAIDNFSNDEISASDCFRKIVSRGVRGCDDYGGIIVGKNNIDRYKQMQGAGYAGIGSNVLSRNGLIILVPHVRSPADSAGVEPGDILTHVEDLEIGSNTTLEEVVTRLRGRVGTEVSIRVMRDNQEVGPLTIKRDEVSVPLMSSGLIGGDTGYIKIYRFGENISDYFEEKVEELTKQRGARSLIVDLRYNPGGFLDEVDDIVTLFSPQGSPTNLNFTYFIQHRGQIISSSGHTGPGEFIGLPLVILVNEFSASASEIMAGVLKDWGVATIVGKKTFGKGSIQRQFFLTTSASGIDFAIRFTWAEYLVGNQRSPVNGVGVDPHEEVDDDKDWRDDPMIPRGQMNIDLDEDKALKKALEILRSP